MGYDGDYIEIAIAITDKDGTYCRHAGALLMSVFCNTSHKVRVHVFTDETLTKDNQDKFEKLVYNTENKICFYYIGEDMLEGANSETIPRLSRYSKAALYRLCIPDILSFPRVIYLDMDIIVNMDIAELWQEELSGKALGVILDTDDTRWSISRNPWYQARGIDGENYFNSGVLVMDLAEIRKCIDLRHDTIVFLQKNPEAPFLDQEALNCYFRGRVRYLDGRYNRLALVNAYVSVREPCIWHYISAKPWNLMYSDSGKLYWYYRMKSPWGGDEKNFKEYLSAAVLPWQWDDSMKNLFIRDSNMNVYDVVKCMCNRRNWQQKAPAKIVMKTVFWLLYRSILYR